MTAIVGEAAVVDAGLLGAYRTLTLRAPEIAATAGPGQFVNLAAGPAHLLRRPFSIWARDVDTGTISVAFDAVGDGTRWLAGREFGDLVGIVGPLGHGYDIPAGAGVDLLVGGGYGTAALALVAAAVRVSGGTPHAIVGGRDAGRLFRDHAFEAACASVTVVTDDGSEGERGLVTDVMPALVDEVRPRMVYACGPMPMLAAVSRVCGPLEVPCQVAVEEFMACGIGVCWTCVLKVRANGDLKHLRSCTEGPVFEGQAVAWA